MVSQTQSAKKLRPCPETPLCSSHCHLKLEIKIKKPAEQTSRLYMYTWQSCVEIEILVIFKVWPQTKVKIYWHNLNLVVVPCSILNVIMNIVHSCIRERCCPLAWSMWYLDTHHDCIIDNNLRRSSYYLWLHCHIQNSVSMSFHYGLGSYVLCRCVKNWHSYEVRINLALNKRSAIECFEYGKIHKE